MEVQTQIPVSLAALHNFIRIHDPKEGLVFGSGSDHFTGDAKGQEDYVAPVLQHGNVDMDESQDKIAEAMWAEYQCICQERGINTDDPFDGDTDEGEGSDGEENIDNDDRDNNDDDEDNI
jgi:hypothetical protein